MLKRIKTKKGQVVPLQEYIGMLQNEYSDLMAAENKDIAKITKVQDEYYALLLWGGQEEEIKEKDLESFVKTNAQQPRDQNRAAGFFIKDKERQLVSNKDVPFYLQKVWPYFYNTQSKKYKAALAEAVCGYEEKHIEKRANIISEMCKMVLALKDEDLLVQNEESARIYIQTNWEVLHIGQEIVDVLDKMLNEYDIVDKSDYLSDKNNKDAKYRKYTYKDGVEDWKFPDKKPFLAALKHKQQLISNLLIYEKKWKAEAEPGQMDLDDWTIVNYDVQPDPQYDNAKIYRHNFVQNAKGRIFAALKGADLAVDDVLEIVKNKMIDEMMAKDYPKGLPQEANAEDIIAEYGKKISEKELYDAAEKYAEKVAVEEKSASDRFNDSPRRYESKLKKVNKDMDDFASGKRRIGDSENGYSYGSDYFAFSLALDDLAWDGAMSDTTRLDSAEILGRFVSLYHQNINRLYPGKEDIKKLEKLSKSLIEIKPYVDKMLEKEEAEAFNKNLDESIEKSKQCIGAASDRLQKLTEAEEKAREEERKLREARKKEEQELRDFEAGAKDREKAFEESDRKIEEKYKSEGIRADELKQDAAEDEERVKNANEEQSKLRDVRAAQRWGYDPCRNVDDPLDMTEEERKKLESERIGHMRSAAASSDLETAQISLLGLPENQFPGNASPYENKLNFITRFLSDPDFKKQTDVAEFIDKQHIVFEKAREMTLSKPPQPEMLMRMYCEAQHTIASLAVYNRRNPAIAAALHEAVDTINLKLYAKGRGINKNCLQPMYLTCVKALFNADTTKFSKEFAQSARLMN